MTIKQIFAKRLQEARTDRRWSQAELIRRLDAIGVTLDKTAMSKIESGDRRVTLDEAVALAAALDVPLHALLLTEGQDDEITLASKLTVRMPFASAWLAGVMPLNRDDVEDYEGVGGSLFDMALLRELPELLSSKPNAHEIEMARAYVAKKRRTWELLEETATSAEVPTAMAQEMRDLAQSARNDMARIEALLPEEKK